jgi:hypothetical protein
MEDRLVDRFDVVVIAVMGVPAVPIVFTPSLPAGAPVVGGVVVARTVQGVAIVHVLLAQRVVFGEQSGLARLLIGKGLLYWSMISVSSAWWISLPVCPGQGRSVYSTPLPNGHL